MPSQIELDGRASGSAAAVRIAPRALPRWRVEAGPAALAVLAAAAAALALGAAGTRYLILAGAGPAVPDWIAGPLADAGWQMAPALTCVLLVAIVLAYLAVLRWSETIPVRWAIGAIVALHVLLLLAPPLLSSDVFNYIDSGRLEAIYGLNPYLAAPLARPADPAFALTGMAWVGSPSVYGPGFTLLAAALAPLGVAAQLWALKALAALASLACTALVWSCARRLGRPPLKATLFFALNPLVLVAAVGGAHNDLLMVLLTLLGVRLALGERTRPAVVAVVGAVAVKLTAALVLPFLVAGGGRPRWRGAAATSVAAAAGLAIVALALFGTAPFHLAQTLSDGGARHVGELRSIPGFLAGYAGVGPIGPLARGLLALACLTAVAALGWRALAGRMPWLTAASWSVVAVLVTSTRLEPWYAVWLIPLAAVSGDRRVQRASHALLLAIAFIAFARYALRLGIGWPHSG
ncbi:MAG TPA: polyprenol phosphomannose-dependent alpha 1,6 mannosyltransferase MptB [Conexibacter sp.]|nr:polyprenol phosphomannose-dependent alpha 1,6 mannosyltransferase MptB [Conexibacter sp.]